MNPSESLPPPAALFQIASSAVAAKALWAVAELGVADHLGEAPASAEALAARTGADGDALYRVMRFLASIGVFSEQPDRRFVHTPMSRALRTEDASRARAAVRTIAGPSFWAAFGEMMHSVRTGQKAWDKVHGLAAFDYLAEHPDEAALFNDAMIGIHGSEPPAVASAYAFSGTVVDVGGGTGNMLIHILKKHPQARGVLYDLDHVAEAGRARLAKEGLADRCRVESGSFFERVPEGGDAYVLSHIIHDWDEASCLRILGNCRAAMKPEARVLIVEMVIPEANQPHPGKALDLVMLSIPGGRERTAEEYGALLQKAQLRLERVVPTASPVSVVEAVRA